MVGALAVAAVGIASLHALAPDHWVPFAVLARAERWSAPRSAAVTALCGAGHVTVSVALGLAGLLLGVEVFEAFGATLAGMAPLLLIGFGAAYAAWGLGRLVRERVHRRMHDAGHAFHHHHHHHHHLDHQPATARALFLLFCADPCVAVIPLMYAAAPAGPLGMAAVIGVYELATMATMVALVLPARAATCALRAGWADRYGDVLAGSLIAAVGIAVGTLGM